METDALDTEQRTVILTQATQCGSPLRFSRLICLFVCLRACCSTLPSLLCAGPEHAASLTPEGALLAWGSNEFSQLALPMDYPLAHRPMPLTPLASKKVLSVACGGSHTLAVVADGGAPVGGVLMAWGTGTVGQLGLGEGMPLAEVPAIVPVPGTALSGGKAVPIAAPYAGLVSSGCVSVLGEAFVWGDASIGRLGSPAHPDMGAGAPLPLVNAAKIFAPTHIAFKPADLGPDTPADASVVCTGMALGGAFTLYTLTSAASTSPGCVLLLSGGLGIDITKDAYGWTPASTGGKKFEAAIEEEIAAIPRRSTPQPVAPFGTKPCVLAAYAGARHAAVIVADEASGGAPRLYTAGKGWLGHAASAADSVMIGSPKVAQFFAPVGGALQGVDGACRNNTIAQLSDVAAIPKR